MTPTLFADLQLAPDVLAAAQRFAEPTAVQQAAIPVVLRGGDLHCVAPTGQGKTAAFALPLLSLLAENPSDQKPRPVRVLVLAPTRELVAQICAEFESFARFVTRPIRVRAVFGGVAVNPQLMALRGGADVLVATPGRLLDVLAHRVIQLDAVCTVVLDEADRMVGADFSAELEQIRALLPSDRQTLWFSATQATQTALAQQWLTEPTQLTLNAPAQSLAASSPAAAVAQQVIAVDASRRTQLLRHLIIAHAWPQVLVFVATRHAASVVAEKLNKVYPSAPVITAAALHGELSQGARMQALADFKAGRLQVLVATDVAARGLHIDALPVVVNYDLPRSPSDYVHRIGRTGRAGHEGLAISFINPATQAHFALIQKRQRTAIETQCIAGFEPKDEAPAAGSAPVRLGLDSKGGIKGARPSKKDALRAATALQTAAASSLEFALSPSALR